MNVILFADIEPILVADIKVVLEAFGATNYRVATQRHPEGFEGTEVIVRADGHDDVEKGVRAQDAAVTLYDNTPDKNTRYKRANQFALWIDAGVKALPSMGSRIRSVSYVSSTPVDDPNSATQVRYITFTTLIKGSNVELPLAAARL